MKTVLFLCTGNYYRSRFAEHLFNRLAEESGLAWRAVSRGLAVGTADNIGPISTFALAGLEKRGIRLAGAPRGPVQAIEADLAGADLVVALKEAEHRALTALRHPGWADAAEYWHIHDLDCAGSEEALAELDREVRALVARLGD